LKKEYVEIEYKLNIGCYIILYYIYYYILYNCVIYFIHFTINYNYYNLAPKKKEIINILQLY